MSRRVLIRAISFLAFAFLILFAMTVQNIQRATRYEQVISDNYYYAFSELLAGVTKLDYALEKCAYSGDDSMLALLCAEAFREAEISSRALSRLPVSELSLENTTKFITQTGDYAYYLAKKASRGEGINAEERMALRNLAGGAGALMDELIKLSEWINDESRNFMNVNIMDSADETLGDIKELEREFSEYPVLVYDGPFADETDGERELLAKLPKIDEEQACLRAAEIFGMSPQAFSVDGTRAEDGIELISVTDGERYADITRMGGIVFRTITSQNPETAKVTVEEAINRATKVLSDNGFGSMEETYYMRYGNTLVVNFAAKQGNTVIYPDLVKVTVSLYDGSVVNFDAAGYIKNKKNRNIKDISGQRELAQSKVAGDLKILSYSPAIIPTDGTGEILTHEFKCETASGEHYIVYINADSMHEERILILIEDENGTLAM